MTIKNIIAGMVLIVIGTALNMCSSSKQPEKSLELSGIIPDSVAGFSREGPVERYTGEEIYRYMDGAGENYRMYDYRSMQVMRMIAPDSNEITIELFDMGDFGSAYGIYTHSREGEDAGVGEGSYSRSGLLCFWQGKYFACLSSLKDTEWSRNAIRELAGIMTSKIPPAGKIPSIMSLLPQKDLIKESVRYFRNYTILNYHYFLADENLLEIDSTTQAFLAQYNPDRTYLLCVRYPSAESAQHAFRRFTSEYMTDTDNEGFMEMSDGTWSAVEAHGDYLAAVFDAPDRDTAAKLFSELNDNINE